MKNTDIFPAEIIANRELTEIISKRSINSKIYNINKNNYRCVKCLGAVHYKDNPSDVKEDWKEIDLTIRDKGNHYVIDKGGYFLKIFKDSIKYSYESKAGGRVDVSLKSIDDVDVSNIGLNLLPKVKNGKENVLEWVDISENLDFNIVARPLKVSLFKIVKGDTGPKNFVWDIYEDVSSHARFKQKTLGMDKNKQFAELTNSIEDKGESISSKTGNSYKHLIFTEEWTGRVGTIIDKQNRKKDWTTNVVYPLIIDADVDEDIMAENDDGTQMFNSLWYSTLFYSAFEFGTPSWFGPPPNYHGAIRFTGINIPPKATITKVDFVFHTRHRSNNPTAMIRGDNVGDAAVFSPSDGPEQFIDTVANATWAVGSYSTTTVPATSIIQEIIDNANWSSGNAMRFALDVTGSPGRLYIGRVYSYKKSQAMAAHLYIDFTLPVVGGGANNMIIGRGAKIGGSKNWPHIG